MSKNIILFDMDNTLSDMDHRLYLIDRANVDWNEFERQSGEDEPILATVEAARAFAAMGREVWIWTGRSDGVEGLTRDWLDRYQVPYTQLLMRPYGDNTTSTLALKRNWLDNTPVPRSRVLCAYDDDPRIIDMLRSEGVDCFRVLRKEGGA